VNRRGGMRVEKKRAASISGWKRGMNKKEAATSSYPIREYSHVKKTGGEDGMRKTPRERKTGSSMKKRIHESCLRGPADGDHSAKGNLRQKDREAQKRRALDPNSEKEGELGEGRGARLRRAHHSIR